MAPADIDVLLGVLRHQRVAALATLHDGEPALSMVPFALLPDGGGLVIHVSRLATHTADLLAHAAVAMLVVAPEAADPPDGGALARPRASLRGTARPLDRDADGYEAARAAYLARFPEAEDLFGFGDFMLVVVAPASLRLVAGFGRAHSLVGPRLAEVLASAA